MNSAVVTIVSDRHEHLRAQRAALARCVPPPDLHIVVSMGDAEIVDVIRDSTDLQTRVIALPAAADCLPLAVARNAGAEAALAEGAELIVMLDVDCLPEPRLIARYAAAAKGTADALLAGAVTYLPPAPEGGWTSEALAAARAPHPARPAPAAGDVIAGEHRLFWSLSFAVRAATWRRLGGFCSQYVGYGGEDTDFAMTAQRLGVPLLWVGGAEAFHQHHPVSRPPVEHVSDIVRNAAVFERRWGWWPMEGWLNDFERSGLVRRTAAGWEEVPPLRVASIPARHPYLDAILPLGAVPALRKPAAGWSLDPLLDPEALRESAANIDVLHVHFGYEQLSETELAGWLDAVRSLRIPLVVTLHDLRNPHQASRERHDRHLRLLTAAAAEVLTLTSGAAGEISARYGATATVVPHPTLRKAYPDPPAGNETEPGLVVMPLKALRTNVIEPARLVRAACEGTRRAGGRLRVDLHPEVLDRAELAGVRQLAAEGRLELQVHDRFSDAELEAYLSRAQVCVLPYRFGTHSGLLELCRDLGTRVVAPSCGHFGGRDGQWDEVVSYRNDEVNGLDEESLADAVARAVTASPVQPAPRAARLAERDEVRAQHHRCYAGLVAR